MKAGDTIQLSKGETILVMLKRHRVGDILLLTVGSPIPPCRDPPQTATPTSGKARRCCILEVALG